MKFQLSIRNLLYLTAVVALLASFVALAVRGDYWGVGITFAATCSFLVWIFSAVAHWMLVLLLNLFGIEELPSQQTAHFHQAPRQVPPQAPGPDSKVENQA